MRRILCGLAMFAAGSVVASAATITVLATDDIFFANQGSIGAGLGTLPGFLDLSTAGLGPLIQVNAGSGAGTINYCGGGTTCPTGDINGGGGQADPYFTMPPGTTFIAGSDGAPSSVSGIIFSSNTANAGNVGQIFFLVGMFTNGSAPSGAAPATLSYTSTPTGNFSPALNQLFFVGSGAGETFVVPTGATNFYLGFADGNPGFTGTVGAYADNTGSLNVSILAAPEPATFGLIGLGLASIGLLRKRIRR
jgi:PEP-CTERM motif-containing protein